MRPPKNRQIGRVLDPSWTLGGEVNPFRGTNFWGTASVENVGFAKDLHSADQVSSLAGNRWSSSRAAPSRSKTVESRHDARPRPFRGGRWPAPSASRSRCGTARPIKGGPLESILVVFSRIAEAHRFGGRARFSSWSAARECKIEDRFVRSVLREMSISD